MPDKFEAGNGDALAVVRYGWDEFDKFDRQADANIYPGQAVTPTTNGDGDRAYALHDGTAGDVYHVARDARGRGMDLNTDDGYPVGDVVHGLSPNGGGGLHLRTQTGETVTDGDALVVAADGNHRLYDSANDAEADIVAHAEADVDLSGADEPGFVPANME